MKLSPTNTGDSFPDAAWDSQAVMASKTQRQKKEKRSWITRDQGSRERGYFTIYVILDEHGDLEVRSSLDIPFLCWNAVLIELSVDRVV